MDEFPPHLGVSKNRGKTPQIIHLFIGFSIIFTIHFGYPYFWFNTHLYMNHLRSSFPVSRFSWDLFTSCRYNETFAYSTKQKGKTRCVRVYYGDCKVGIHHLWSSYIFASPMNLQRSGNLGEGCLSLTFRYRKRGVDNRRVCHSKANRIWMWDNQCIAS